MVFQRLCPRAVALSDSKVRERDKGPKGAKKAGRRYAFHSSQHKEREQCSCLTSRRTVGSERQIKLDNTLYESCSVDSPNTSTQTTRLKKATMCFRTDYKCSRCGWVKVGDNLVRCPRATRELLECNPYSVFTAIGDLSATALGCGRCPSARPPQSSSGTPAPTRSGWNGQ